MHTEVTYRMKSQLICHGRLRNHALVRYALREYGADLHYTTAPRHARELATNIDTETDVLMVAGGDGTLHEVVDGLMQLPQELRPPVLLLPLGSGNDTARMIGAKATASDIERRLAAFDHITWDVLECRVGDVQQIRYCTNVLDVGFGGDVARRFNSSLRRLPARFGYVVATLQSFIRAQPQEMTVSVDEAEYAGTMLLTAIANSKWFGSGIGIAPHARPNDGELDITMVKDVGPLTYLRFLPSLSKGLAIDDARIEYLRATSCSVSTRTPLPIEIDGEFAGYTPLQVHVHRGAVRLLV